MPQALELQIVSMLTNIIQSIGWIGIMLIMAIESANIPIPSEVTMPLAGWLLVQARGGSLIEAILLGGLIGALGCLFGSIMNYGVGLYGGRPFVERYGKYFFISKKDIARADKWFARWGDWASFLWCAALATGGYLLGEHWKELRDVMRPFDYPIIALIVVGLGYYVYRHIRHAREDANEIDEPVVTVK